MSYAAIDRIQKILQARVTLLNINNIGIQGLTSTEIGLDLVKILIPPVEQMMDMYLGMVYVMPLINDHVYLQQIADFLVSAQILEVTFSASTQGNDSNTDGLSTMLRSTALNNFQTLFNGTGIFVSGADEQVNISVQNDELRAQQQNKPLILPGEKLKGFIGYDVDGDSISDTDLFKLNNVSPSFYVTGNLDHPWNGAFGDVWEGIRVKSRGNPRPDFANIDFYG
jgi:hypothetical protein